MEAKLLDIYDGYLDSRKHSRRSADQCEMERNLYPRLTALCENIASGQYLPSCYSFIHRRPKAREVFALECEMKAVQCYIMKRMRPIIERHLCDRTFNNRIGKGMHAAIKQVQQDMHDASEGYTKEAWIIALDFKGYFTNIVQGIAYRQWERLVDEEYQGADKDFLKYAVSLSCFVSGQVQRCEKRSPQWEWDADIPDYKSLFKKPEGIGGLIGSLWWQTTANLYPADEDFWILENITPYYSRYVDDLTMIVTDKEMALSMLPELRRRLALKGIELHPNKFYCQKVTHGLRYLGYHIMPNRIHVDDKIFGRAMKAARRRCGEQEYLSSVNSYLGMMKDCNEFKRCNAVLDQCERIGRHVDRKRMCVITNRQFKKLISNP